MPDTPLPRSYGCSFGCGNPYDYIFVSCADGTTEFLCLPCLLQLSKEMLEAVLNPDSPEALRALQDMSTVQQAPFANGSVKRRGKNAPVNSEDADLYEAFDSVITEDELPDEFR